jgi:hypothetical protein
MTTRKKWIVLFIVAVPLSFFILPFACGFCNLSQGLLIFLAPVLLLGPLCAGSIVAALIQNASRATRMVSGIATAFVIFISFFLFPPGAATWTLGLAANFRLTKHPAQIQQWAIEVLDQYENGKLTTTTNVEYWAAGRDKLVKDAIPLRIQNLWRHKPSIGIATITDNGWVIQSTQTNAESLAKLTGGISMPLKLSHCVAFSWYDTGILVGRPDFQSKWNPWDIHEIMPGVYAFSGMR